MTWRTGTWDYVKIDGVRLAGRVTQFAIAPSRNIESTPVPGLDGVDLRDQGYVGSPVTIGIECWRGATQFDLLVSQLAVFNPRQPGVALKPRKVEHPIARVGNITQIYIIGFSTDMPDESGRWQVEIQAFQFAKAKKKLVPLGGGSLDVDVNPAPNPAGYGANFP